jgi:hypothetical protein
MSDRSFHEHFPASSSPISSFGRSLGVNGTRSELRTIVAMAGALGAEVEIERSFDEQVRHVTPRLGTGKMD